MSPEPIPGHYADSCGSIYVATLQKKTGWHLQKWRAANGQPVEGGVFAAATFPNSVRLGHFTLVEPSYLKPL